MNERTLHLRKDLVVVRRTAPKSGVVIGSGSAVVPVGLHVVLPVPSEYHVVEVERDGEALLLMTVEEFIRYTKRYV